MVLAATAALGEAILSAVWEPLCASLGSLPSSMVTSWEHKREVRPEAGPPPVGFPLALGGGGRVSEISLVLCGVFIGDAAGGGG